MHWGPALVWGTSDALVEIGVTSTGREFVTSLQEVSDPQESTLHERWRMNSTWVSTVLCSPEDNWMMGWG